MASVAKQQEQRIRTFHINRIRSLDNVEVNQAAIDALRIKVDFDQASAAKKSTQTQ
jgi:hypothetical protein